VSGVRLLTRISKLFRDRDFKRYFGQSRDSERNCEREDQLEAGGEGRRGGGQTEVGENGVRGLGGGDEGEDAHVAAAIRAGEGEDLVGAGEEASPAGGGGGVVRRVWQVGDFRSQDGAAAVRVAGRHDSVAIEVDDPFAEAGVRGKDAVIAVAVDAGWRDEAGEGGEKLEAREGEDGAAVAGGTRRVIENLADRGLVETERRRCPAR
jgi:hypothetical protein